MLLEIGSSIRAGPLIRNSVTARVNPTQLFSCSRTRDSLKNVVLTKVTKDGRGEEGSVGPLVPSNTNTNVVGPLVSSWSRGMRTRHICQAKKKDRKASGESKGAGVENGKEEKGKEETKERSGGGRVKGSEKEKERGRERERVGGGEADVWLGAVVFTYISGQYDYAFTTTLERLGLDDLSTSVSSAKSAAMIQVALEEEGMAEDLQGATGARGKEGKGTEVLISMRVGSIGKDLLAEGRVDTVFGLQCSRCLTPTTFKVRTKYQLLLTASPVEEPTLRSMGVVIGDSRWDSEDVDETFLDGMDGAGSSTGILDLDLDDKIYFPQSQNRIDLSKYFRDTVLLEVPIKVLCQDECKGMCLECGTNFNVSSCKCGEEIGPFGGVEWTPGRGQGSLADQLRAQLKRKEKGWE